MFPVRSSCAIALLASFVWSGAAVAQNQSLEGLYQRVLADPSNVSLTIQYAQLARQMGDYEAAISAYERLLLFNQDLPQLKYELGALYFELESYAAAKTYFEAVLATPNLSPALRNYAQTYLTEVNIRLSPTRTRVYLHGGLRYQTNATAGAGSDIIRLNGAQTKNTDARARPDWNGFGLATVDFAHDYGTGAEDTFEATLGSYYARQFEIERVNLGAADLQAGPRFTIFPESIVGASAKVYGIVNGFTLADDAYSRSLGGGVSARWKYSPRLVMETAVEYRDRRYFNSHEYPDSADQTGDFFSASAGAGGLLYGSTRWFVRVGYEWNDAVKDFWDSQRPYGDIGFSTPVAVPWGYKPWLFSVYGGGSWQDFSKPDPSIDASVTREDWEWHVGLNVDAEFAANFGMRLNVSFQKNESNLPNYTYQNFAVSFGPTMRF
jgi:tetratricopeptide (TPR) repeat protein